MRDHFTKRNHYNPCFWTALWNSTYFAAFLKGVEGGHRARNQTVLALGVKSNNIRETKVDSIHYDKGLGIAEITPESMKSFCKRWHPTEYDDLATYLEFHPETLYLDFEDILEGIEGTGTYQALISTGRYGDISSVEEKGYLSCLLILHAMRSHDMMSAMVGSSRSQGLHKWEYFWLLKHAWGNPLLLARAAAPLAMARWVLYRSSDRRFPLCDSPIMIDRDSVMAVLSPELLLEIDLTVEANEDSWSVRDGMSGRKRSEFRRRAIANSYKDIIFTCREEAQRWQALPEFQKRVTALSDRATERRLIAEGANRVIWALTGFGRVPPEFETWVAPFFST